MEHYYEEPTHIPRNPRKLTRCSSMGILNHVEILKNFTIKYELPLPQIITHPDQHSWSHSFFLAQASTLEHLIIQSGKTKELAENKAALGLLKLLIQYYDLCDKDDTETYRKKIKTKDQEVQTDPRPKLVPLENSCKYCNTQVHSTKECLRNIIKKVDKTTQIPPPTPLRNPQILNRLLRPFCKRTPRPKTTLL